MSSIYQMPVSEKIPTSQRIPANEKIPDNQNIYSSYQKSTLFSVDDTKMPAKEHISTNKHNSKKLSSYNIVEEFMKASTYIKYYEYYNDPHFLQKIRDYTREILIYETIVEKEQK